MSRRTGEIIELKFAVKAFERGINVSKPLLGDMPYDLILDHNGELLRIQIKSSNYNDYGYKVLTSHTGTKQPYTENEIDFFAIYIQPIKIWYLIPVDAIRGRKTIKIMPERESCEFKKYRENWELIKPPRKFIVLQKKKISLKVGYIKEVKVVFLLIGEASLEILKQKKKGKFF
jgi:hypothetical protein